MTLGSSLTAVTLARTPLVRGAAWLVLAAQGTGFFLQMYARMQRVTGNDLGARLASARILVEGGNPYALTLPQGHGPYPLTIDVLVIPLTWIPLGLAQSLWFALSVAALVGTLLVLDGLWREARRGEADPVLAVPFEVRLALLTLALFIPLQNHLRYGQVNLLLLCLSTVFLAFHLRGRRCAAAASLGGAIALKLTPAVFLVYLGRGRWYRTAVGAIGWTLLLAVAVPALVSPRVLEWYRDGWLPEVAGLTAGPVEYEWRTRFTLAALLAERWPPIAALPGLRHLAAAAVLLPILWIQPRLARDTARDAAPLRALRDGDAARLARERDASPGGAGGAPVDLAPGGGRAAPHAAPRRRRGGRGPGRALARHRAGRPSRRPARVALRRGGPAGSIRRSAGPEPSRVGRPA